MLIVLGVAAGAALAVIVFNRVREQDPELASASLRKVHQLAAVIVVITSGVERTFDALQSGQKAGTSRPSGGYSAQPAYRGARPLVESWQFDDDEPWDRP